MKLYSETQVLELLSEQRKLWLAIGSRAAQQSYPPIPGLPKPIMDVSEDTVVDYIKRLNRMIEGLQVLALRDEIFDANATN